MDHTLIVHIDQAPCNIAQLHEPYSRQREYRSLNRERTSSNRFASGCAATNWVMFPFGIHSDTIENSVSVIITPRSGNTFGCRRAFHVTNSLQNICTVHGHRFSDRARNKEYDQRPTRVIFCGSLAAYVLNILTATSRP